MVTAQQVTVGRRIHDIDGVLLDGGTVDSGQSPAIEQRELLERKLCAQNRHDLLTDGAESAQHHHPQRHHCSG